MDVGLGLLATAAAVRRLRPDVDLVLSTDPDGMPWGVRTPEDLTARALLVAEAAAAFQPDLLIVACNTATLLAMPAIRASLGTSVVVVETLPAVAEAAAGGGPFAVWGTPTGVRSEGLQRLLGRFAAGVSVAEVACHGLSDAIETADAEATTAAITAAVAKTPIAVRSVVLACTHYELVAPQIRAVLLRGGGGAGPALHGSADALARRALASVGLKPQPGVAATGSLTVLRSGRVEELPAAASAYVEGRLLHGSAVPG
ncbi:aspartate/glutamate racemase family protein [Streptomyces sp. NBC_01198]|nr:aspartate/glutamate racemase family protein [Streptomyces sp. NBC_01198]WSR66930.1 aspartate/glutamate racemase family protein [Streptomyces sp. NBC_01198]